VSKAGDIVCVVLPNTCGFDMGTMVVVLERYRASLFDWSWLRVVAPPEVEDRWIIERFTEIVGRCENWGE
jgi:hypothetical protein